MSTTASPTTLWPSELTGVCERLAARLHRSGATHPVAAAVALAARGHSGLDPEQFAAHHGLVVDAVRRSEAGDIAWQDLPDVIGNVVEAMGNIDLLALADLDANYRRTASPHDGTTHEPTEPGGGN